MSQYHVTLKVARTCYNELARIGEPSLRNDSRLPRVLHALLHLSEMKDPATSVLIGRMLGTNASVVRRTMAGLRDAGIVSSTKGHGGGWMLSKPLADITLADVHHALGAPSLFALEEPDEMPNCLMERAANRVTKNAMDKASAVFAQELKATTVADLAEDFRVMYASIKREA